MACTTSAKRRTCRTSSSPPVSTRPGSSPGPASARCWPTGSSTAGSSIDLPEADPARVMPHETNRRFLEQRVTETLDVAYDMHWPYYQRQSARPLRRSPLYDRTAANGAVFGELMGWERPNWYAPDGVEPRVRVRLRPPELVRARRRRTSSRARGGRCVRHLHLREVLGARSRRGRTSCSGSAPPTSMCRSGASCTPSG